MIANAKKFQPGVSGNPGGRPKGIAAKAREHTDKAVEVLAEALDDEDRRVRIAAANSLLDRGYGKPITMTADVSRKLDELGDDELAAGIDAVRAALDVAAADAAGADEATKH